MVGVFIVTWPHQKGKLGGERGLWRGGRPSGRYLREGGVLCPIKISATVYLDIRWLHSLWLHKMILTCRYVYTFQYVSMARSNKRNYDDHAYYICHWLRRNNRALCEENFVQEEERWGTFFLGNFEFSICGLLSFIGLLGWQYLQRLSEHIAYSNLNDCCCCTFPSRRFFLNKLPKGTVTQKVHTPPPTTQLRPMAQCLQNGLAIKPTF